jgi:2-keto-4-pentenoate hydratase/2-oxohepta-3-ene-1,7-dioic acid hydratase in catechol pathway
MKLITYKDNGGTHVGALIDDGEGIADLKVGAESKGIGSHHFTDMLTLISGGDEALEAARLIEKHALATGEGVVAATDVKILAPVPRPPFIRDFSCFEEHIKATHGKMLARISKEQPEMEEVIKGFVKRSLELYYQRPPFYKANPSNVIGPDEDIPWPAYSQIIDYELELGCFIGKPTKDVDQDRAAEHIFGFTVFNDFSARDEISLELVHLMGPAKGKDFDKSKAIGPCIVTADSFNPYSADMIVRVNGEERSRNNSSTMYWRFEDCIAFASRSETLYPGELLGSGTVSGGTGIELDRFLEPGDVIELEIEGIGILRNRIV